MKIFIKSTILVLVSLLSWSFALAENPAVEAIIPLKTMIDLKNKILPEYISKLTSLFISDIHQETSVSFITVKIDVTNIKIEQVYIDVTQLNLQFPATDSVQLLGNGIGVDIRADFHIKAGIISTSGWLEAKTRSTSFNVITKVALNDKKLINVQITGLDVDLNNLDISLHGDVIAWLADLLVSLFNSQVKKSVNDAIKDAVRSTVPELVDDIMKKIPTIIPLPVSYIPYSLTYYQTRAPYFHPQYCVVFAKAFLFESSKQPTPPPIPEPADMPLPSTITDKLQIEISNYMLNAIGYSIAESKLATFTLTNELIAKYVHLPTPIRLNTDEFEPLFPSISTVFGKNKSIQLRVSISKPIDFRIANQNLSTLATIDCDVLIEQENNETVWALTFQMDYQFDINLRIEQGKTVFVNILYGQCKDAVEIKTALLYPMEIKALQTFLNLAFNFGIPIFQQSILDKGIVIPDIEVPIIKIQDFDFYIKDNYIEAFARITKLNVTIDYSIMDNYKNMNTKIVKEFMKVLEDYAKIFEQPDKRSFLSEIIKENDK